MATATSTWADPHWRNRTAAALEAGLPWYFTIASRSMRPTLWPGQQIEVQRCTVEDLRIGDLLCVYRGEERPCVHRLVAIEGSGDHARFITSGDANDHLDEAVEGEQILGRVYARFVGPIRLVETHPLQKSLDRIARLAWSPLYGTYRRVRFWR